MLSPRGHIAATICIRTVAELVCDQIRQPPYDALNRPVTIIIVHELGLGRSRLCPTVSESAARHFWIVWLYLQSIVSLLIDCYTGRLSRLVSIRSHRCRSQSFAVQLGSHRIRHSWNHYPSL